jgi:hypothetical protein
MESDHAFARHRLEKSCMETSLKIHILKIEQRNSLVTEKDNMKVLFQSW